MAEKKQRDKPTAAHSAGTHTQRRPGDGRLLVLANAVPQGLSKRFLTRCIAHLACRLVFGIASLVCLGVQCKPRGNDPTRVSGSSGFH